jgi:hypothetical protein
MPFVIFVLVADPQGGILGRTKADRGYRCHLRPVRPGTAFLTGFVLR